MLAGSRGDYHKVIHETTSEFRAKRTAAINKGCSPFQGGIALRNLVKGRAAKSIFFAEQSYRFIDNKATFRVRFREQSYRFAANGVASVGLWYSSVSEK